MSSAPSTTATSRPRETITIDRRTEAELAKLPEGEYVAEGYVDNDGFTDLIVGGLFPTTTESNGSGSGNPGGSAAVYIPIDHPEVEEFIEIRRPTGGDPMDVKDASVIMAATDAVAMDAWAFEHLLERPGRLPEYLHLAEAKGSGKVQYRGRLEEIV